MILFATSRVVAQNSPDTTEAGISLHDPAQLIQESDVLFERVDRTFGKAKFEGLKQRYSTIEGIVMVGVVNNDGEVLLRGSDQWSPPGGAVQPGEDWAAAARRIIGEQTGASIRIEHPALIEKMYCTQKGDEEKQFSAFIVHFQAQLAKDSTNATDPGSLDNFSWFKTVPDRAHPNHIRHIKLFVQ